MRPRCSIFEPVQRVKVVPSKRLFRVQVTDLNQAGLCRPRLHHEFIRESESGFENESGTVSLDCSGSRSKRRQSFDGTTCVSVAFGWGVFFFAS